MSSVGISTNRLKAIPYSSSGGLAIADFLPHVLVFSVALLLLLQGGYYELPSLTVASFISGAAIYACRHKAHFAIPTFVLAPIEILALALVSAFLSGYGSYSLVKAAPYVAISAASLCAVQIREGPRTKSRTMRSGIGVRDVHQGGEGGDPLGVPPQRALREEGREDAPDVPHRRQPLQVGEAGGRRRARRPRDARPPGEDALRPRRGQPEVRRALGARLARPW